MCFIKTSAPKISSEPTEIVERHEANATLTKNSNQNLKGYQENLKTTPIGLEDNANTKRKTLLGE